MADLDDLHVSDFGRIDIEAESDDEEDYSDPVDMRARFQLLVEKLLAEVRLVARMPNDVDLMSGFITVEKLAEIRGVKPHRISQIVSEFKAKKGRYPAWRISIPGKQRGFKVDIAVYEQGMDRW